MATVDALEKSMDFYYEPEVKCALVTRPEAKQLSEDKGIQTSIPSSPVNMRMLENEQSAPIVPEKIEGHSHVKPALDIRETALQLSQLPVSPLGRDLQHSQQPLELELRKQGTNAEDTCLTALTAFSSEGFPASGNGGPTLLLDILFVSGGIHPYKIDREYLRKQEVNATDGDPFTLTVASLKQLIWRDWKSDRESRPSSSSAIGLISFGKMLEDKDLLSECRFNREGPNVVHMTVRPQVHTDDEYDYTGDVKNAVRQDREEVSRSPSCRCVIL